jgi:predicted DNA-binding transcriptional regulator AlpA
MACRATGGQADDPRQRLRSRVAVADAVERVQGLPSFGNGWFQSPEGRKVSEIEHGADSGNLDQANDSTVPIGEMVPLADSTIYEMEQCGEFRRRFALSPRCVVWDLAEVEAWLEKSLFLTAS